MREQQTLSDDASHARSTRVIALGQRRRLHMALVAALFAATPTTGCVRDAGPEPVTASPAADETIQPVPGATLKLADEVRQAGDLDSAGALYRVAAREQPNDPAPLIRLGEVELQRRAFDKSAGAYRAALVLAPQDPVARLGLARAHVAAGQPGAAIETLDALPASLPDDGQTRDVLAVRGIALDMLGRHADAQALYRRGLARAPRDLRLQNNLALSLLLSGDAPAAVAILRATAADPLADDRHRRNLALALVAAGDEEGARRTLQQLPDGQVRSVIETGRTIRSAGPGRTGLAPDLGIVTMP